MEDVLRGQAEAGYFGTVNDIDAEVDRRIALLRAGNFAASLTFQTAARQVRSSCATAYQVARRRCCSHFMAMSPRSMAGARQALRDTGQSLAREQASRTRLLEVIAHELNGRTTALTQAIDRLQSMDVQPSIRSIRCAASGRSLAGLATDAA